jgi:hypothetical protein
MRTRSSRPFESAAKPAEGTAIGVHPIIGYTDAIHVLPAVATAALYFVGLALMRPAMQPKVPFIAE